MQLRNLIAFALIIVSFILLYPGLTRDLITISASIQALGITQTIFENTRSILQTIDSLHESGNDFVAFLILLFSVLVPIIKGILLLVALFIKNLQTRFNLYIFVRSISKWSMADVFVVGVFVAYLSAKATDNLDAEIHVGFYYFAAYCLVSLTALQFMKIEDPRLHAGAEGTTG